MTVAAVCGFGRKFVGDVRSSLNLCENRGGLDIFV